MSHQARPEPVFRQMVAAGPLQPSCQREYAFRRTGIGDDGHIGKDAGSPSEEPGKPQSDNRRGDHNGLLFRILQIRLCVKIAFANTPTEIPQKHRLKCHKSADLILGVIDFLYLYSVLNFK